MKAMYTNRYVSQESETAPVQFDMSVYGPALLDSYKENRLENTDSVK